LSRADFKRLKGEGTKAALKELTLQNRVPGVLAYVAGQPIGWCSIGPRQSYPALDASPTLKRVDDTPVWSIACFYVAKAYRKKGIMAELLHGAVNYAAGQGARVIEAYPIDLQTHPPAGQRLHGCTGYMGIASVFRAAGFTEVAHPSETQRVMRLTL
jgi:GNAT superfamily N-acetyltransferase